MTYLKTYSHFKKVGYLQFIIILYIHYPIPIDFYLDLKKLKTQTLNSTQFENIRNNTIFTESLVTVKYWEKIGLDFGQNSHCAMENVQKMTAFVN